jgi:hypothetical protein
LTSGHFTYWVLNFLLTWQALGLTLKVILG